MTTRLLFGKDLATSSPYFGGVTGSKLPDKDRAPGALEDTGSRKLAGILPCAPHTTRAGLLKYPVIAKWIPVVELLRFLLINEWDVFTHT